jgi:aspartyl-tRNA synthetase
MGTLSKSDAAWYQKRFNLRCARIAEIINRPAFRFLQEAGKVPHPPHAGLACGQRCEKLVRNWTGEKLMRNCWEFGEKLVRNW